MKKHLSIALLISILITSFIPTVSANEVVGNVGNKDSIIIKLTQEKDTKSETKVALVKSSLIENHFSIDYRIDDGQVIVGKKDKEDLINLLWLASEITGDKYELLDKRAVQYNERFKDALGDNFKTIVLNKYKDNKLVKSIEFAPSWISNSSMNNGLGGTFEIDDTIPHPHIFNYMNEEIGYYYLPLRYIFEELGFNVTYNHSDNTIIISDN